MENHSGRNFQRWEGKLQLHLININLWVVVSKISDVGSKTVNTFDEHQVIGCCKKYRK